MKQGIAQAFKSPLLAVGFIIMAVTAGVFVFSPAAGEANGQEPFLVAQAETGEGGDTQGDINDPGPSEESGVVVIEGPDFVATTTGYALMQVTIQNTMDRPAKNIVFDLIVFLKERKRSETISIPFEGGETAPGLLMPGETGFIERGILASIDDIGGHRYRIRYGFDEIIDAPQEGDPLPEGVREVIIPGKKPE